MKELDKDHYVAHFTSSSTALEYILPSHELRLSKAGTVNDPYENKMDWFDCDPSTQPSGTISDCLNQKDRIRHLLENHIKLFCVTQFQKPEANEIGSENFYYAIPSMWSHYGGRHKGICLIFDKNQLTEQMQKIPIEGNMMCQEVQYHSDLDVIGDGGGISADRSKYPELISDIKRLYIEINYNGYLESKFYRKHKCWGCENEFRWLLFTKAYSDVYVNYGEALKAIVLGANFGYNTLDNPREFICKLKSHAPVYALQCLYGQYKINKM